MAQFQYRARNRNGGLVTGTMEAPNREMVGLELGRLGHFPVSIQPLGDAGGEGTGLSFNVNVEELFARIKMGDLVLFTRQMATLFRAGIPLVGILGSLAEQMENPRMRKVVEKMRQDIEDGLSLSEAMERHPSVFSDLYVSMIRAGEEGGIMDEILHRLADLLEKQAQNEAKVRSALRYPKIVVGAMIIAIVILMWKVVPVFVNMFQQFDLELPLATRILIAVNTFFLENWYYPLVIFIGLMFSFRQYTATPRGREQWDRLKLKLPLLGPIILRASMAKFARVFGNLQRAGVPILDTLEVTSRVVDNVVIGQVIRNLKGSVQEGLGLAAPLKASGWVPALVVQMVAAGEDSGALDEMLIKVADYYDEEVDRAVATLSSMIEPILIVFMGGVVLFLALAIFLPMWDMSKIARPRQ